MSIWEHPQVKEQWKAILRRAATDKRWFWRGFVEVAAESGEHVKVGSLLATQARVQDIIDQRDREQRPCKIAVLKARRHRISTLAQLNMAHALYFRRGVQCLTLAHDHDTTLEIARMQETFYWSLPAWLRPKLDKLNQREVKFDNPDSDKRSFDPGMGSRMVVQCASGKARKSGAEQEAAGFFRGGRVNIAHGSEVAFWASGEALATALLSTLPELPGTLVIFESTANGQAGYYYELWQKIKAGESDFDGVFLPWYEHPHYTTKAIAHAAPRWADTPDEHKLFNDWRNAKLIEAEGEAERCARKLGLSEEEQKLALEHPVRWDQLKWRRWAVIARCGNRVERFHVEYPSDDVEAFLASGSPRFDNKKIQLIITSDMIRKPDQGWIEVQPPTYEPLAQAKDPPALIKFRSVNGKYRGEGEPLLHVFEPPSPERSYIVSADVAKGLGGDADDSVITVLERQRRRLVARIGSNEIKPDEVAEWMILLGWLYRGGVPQGAMLCPEVDGPGNTTMTYLVNSDYRRFFLRQRLDKQRNKWLDEPGWQTNSASRDEMISRVDIAIKNDELWCPERLFWRQCLTFVRHPPSTPFGKARDDHLKGAHDDFLFALGIGFMVNELSEPDALKRTRQEELFEQWAQWPSSDRSEDEFADEDEDAVGLSQWLAFH